MHRPITADYHSDQSAVLQFVFSLCNQDVVVDLFLFNPRMGVSSYDQIDTCRHGFSQLYILFKSNMGKCNKNITAVSQPQVFRCSFKRRPKGKSFDIVGMAVRDAILTKLQQPQKSNSKSVGQGEYFVRTYLNIKRIVIRQFA